VYDCLVVAVVWWGRGKEARRVEGEGPEYPDSSGAGNFLTWGWRDLEAWDVEGRYIICGHKGKKKRRRYI
jgi:hypothetical protein